MTQPAYRPDRDSVPSGSAPRACRNLTSRDGAELLAAELDAWWHDRGYPNARHTVEWIGLGRHAGKRRGHIERATGAWVVRSNLVNGMPPR
jgi:hypothetical protein